MICTLAAYRRYTGDTSTYDADATSALTDAQSEIERLTGRLFESAARTETLRVQDNRVWPTAYPVTAVTTPTNAIIQSPSVIVTPANLWEWAGTSVFPTNSWGWAGTLVPATPAPTQTVSYTGGYTVIPVGLQRLCAVMAQLMLVPTSPAHEPTQASTDDLEGHQYPPLAVLQDWPLEIQRNLSAWRHIKARLG